VRKRSRAWTVVEEMSTAPASPQPPAAPMGAAHPAAAGRTAAPVDVVFTFSYMTWATVSRRGWYHAEDRLLRTLLDHPRVGRVMICSHFRSLPLKVARDLTAPPVDPPPPHAHLVEPVRLRRIDPTGERALRRTYAAYDRRLRRAAQRIGLVDPVVITAHPLIAGYADLSWARAVTYYAIDDWTEHPGYRRWWDDYRAAHERVARSGRRVVTISDVVLDRLAPTGPSAVMPNGLEPEEWRAPVPPAWAETTRRPLLAYVGTLDSRLDVEAIARLAAAMPEAQIILAGPQAERGHLAPLRGLANVEIRPPMGREDVTGLLHAADVGLVPHVASRLTAGMSPLKLYEYLAAGLPVAATDLPPMRGVDPRVELVPEGGDLAAAVSAALRRGRASEEDRLAFVAENAWRRRHDELIDLALA
jgi:teichuronic acid biosynthesis glycosyltransferase TuaH